MKRRTGFLVKRGNTYFATWYVNGKRFQQTTGKKNKKDAESRMAEIVRPFIIGDEVEVLRNIASSIEGRKAELEEIESKKNPPLAVATAWPVYLKSSRRPDSGSETMRKYKGQYEMFAKWMATFHPAKKNLRDVDQRVAGVYADYLISEKHLTSNTFNKHIRLLTLVFRVLHKESKLTENPWTEVTRKTLNMISRRELSTDELKSVCSTATGEMRFLFAIGIYTGMRLGDCVTLKWNEINLTKGVIKRIPNKTARLNPKPITVPIHPVLLTMLMEITEDKRVAYVLPDFSKLYTTNSPGLIRKIQLHFESCGIRTIKPGTGYEVSVGSDGKSVRTFTEKRAVVEVGFHSLRHTFVSLCREANAPLSVVESIVGHSNPAMTRHYTHTSEAAAITAVGALPVFTGDLPAVNPPLPDPLSILRQKVSELADRLNADNWQAIKKEMADCIKIE